MFGFPSVRNRSSVYAATISPRISRLADGAVRVVAPAKINLSLWVGARGKDGYHPVESLVAWISLVDRLTVQRGGGKGCELICSDPGLACDANNLVVRAAQAPAGIELDVMSLAIGEEDWVARESSARCFICSPL